MLNGEKLLYQLLLALTPEGVTLKPDLDVDAIDRFPYVTFTSIAGPSRYTATDAAPKAWDWSLDMSIFHDDLEAGAELASFYYDLVHSWNDVWLPEPTFLIPGLGHVAEVTDKAPFARVGTSAIDGHSITQYQGGFDLQLHQA